MQAAISANDKTLIKRLATISIAGFLLLSVAAIIIMKTNENLATLIISGLYVAAVLIACSACLWASRNTSHYKRLWRLMAFGMLLWLLGAITIVTYLITRGAENVPSPSIADLFSVAYLPIFIAIITSIGKIKPPFDARKKIFMANVAMVGLSMLLFCYKFILLPIWHANPELNALQRMFTIAYPLFDWVMITSVLFASRRLLENRVGGWLILIILGFLFCVIADIPVYLYGYQMNPVTALFLIAAALLAALAAIDEVTGAFIGVIERKRPRLLSSDPNIPTIKPWSTLVIPILTTSVIPIVWLSSSNSGGGHGVFVLVAVSAMIILLSIYRNHLLASENAVLFSKVLRDSLTGLNNHRYFQEALSKVVARADRMGKLVSLAVIDIDNFRQINNAYGHTFGDKVLSVVGGALSSSARESDEVCRLSEDGFGIIIPDLDGDEAVAVVESVKEEIDTALSASFPGEKITMTIGVSTYPELASDKDELLHTADGALYWGKLHGKGSVLLYDAGIVEALSAEERAKRAEEAALVDMVKSLAKAVDARDKYTRLHSKRVGELAKKLAQSIGLDEETVNRIEIAGVLHDIGKIGIPDSILKKPGRLTEKEISAIRNHPLISAQIIQSTSLKDIISAVGAHHERWDGAGYPFGFSGEDIPIEARILAIADTFDAMTSDRPYRDAISIEDALNEIKKCAGTQFDPILAQKFLEMFTDDHPGTKATIVNKAQLDAETRSDTDTQPGSGLNLASGF